MPQINAMAAHTDNISYAQPDFDIEEDEKDKDWFIQSVRYFSTLYNRKPALNIGFQREDSDDFLTPVERGLKYSLYLLGKQDNIDYNFVTSDDTGDTLQSVWIKGKKIRQLVNHLVGNLINQLENKQITTINLSKDVESKKSKMLSDLMMRFDRQLLVFFEQLEKLGVRFIPAGDREFQSEDDIKRFLEFEWKDNLQVLSSNMGKHIEQSNDVNSKYIQLFMDFLAADYCGMYTHAENGKILQKRIPFYDLIWDHGSEDPLNRNLRYVGFIERSTPQELFSKYPQLTDEEKKEIKEAAKGQSSFKEIQSRFNTTNFNWWTYKSDQMIVTTVTMFWIGRRDLRFEERKNEDGTVSYIKTKDLKKDFFTDDLHKATLIGNKYLVDWGYSENVIRSRENKSDPEMPIKILSGSSILGDRLSIVGMIHQNQDRMDFYRFKIIEIIGKDAGKNYIINGNKLGETVKTRELLQDFKSMGMHVAPGVSGESSDPTDNQRTVEVVDMTLDPSILRYVDLYHEEERIMEEVMNIPKIALGQQQATVGLGVQRGTIAQSTLGLISLYRNFVKFNEINLQYSVNLAKLIYTIDDTEAVFVVGDRGIQHLKWIKQYRFQDVLLFIKTKDIIDENKKQRLLAIAQAMAQNQQIDMLDYINIEMAENMIELKNDLEFSLKKRREEIAIAQNSQTLSDKAIRERNITAKSELEDKKQSSMDERSLMESQERITREFIKVEKTEETEETATS